MTSRDTLSTPERSPEGDDSSSNVSASPHVTLTTQSAEQTDCDAPEVVLKALADTDCRAILAASARQSLSVSDVIEQFDIPTATAYRKVNMLAKAGLLHEHIQIYPYGRNEHEYSLRVEAIQVELSESGMPEATVSLTCELHSRPPRQVITDGGEITDGSENEDDETHLSAVFEKVTGAKAVVDEQETQSQDRHVGAGENQSISEYLSNVVQDDGLSDSLPERDAQGND